MYRLVRFGTLSLEHANQVDDVGSGDTPTHYIPLPDGGAIDAFGAMQKHPGVVERVKSLRLSVSTETDLAPLYFRLLALRGKRDRLFRRLPDGTEHWQWARLVSVTARRSYEQAKFKKIQDLELRFVSGEMTWRGTHQGVWFLNDGQYLNDGLFFNEDLTSVPVVEGTTTFSVTVGAADDAGRAPVRALQIRLTAGDAYISGFQISRTGGEQLWHEFVIPAGDVMVVDTGTLQVTVNGLEAYTSNFGAIILPEIGAWFSLLPGVNQITVELLGGGVGSKLDLVYNEAWY